MAVAIIDLVCNQENFCRGIPITSYTLQGTSVSASVLSTFQLDTTTKQLQELLIP